MPCRQIVKGYAVLGQILACIWENIVKENLPKIKRKEGENVENVENDEEREEEVE